MPTYDYRCKVCGYEFELVQKINEKPCRVCPQCGGEVYRLLSPSPFILKGSGWYVTDYVRKSQTGDSSLHKSSEASLGSSKEGAGQKKTTSLEKGDKAGGEGASKSETMAVEK